MKAIGINPKQLIFFYEVFKWGSICTAANRLSLAKASVDRQIQLLEKELGMRLFERGQAGRRMVPTEAAQILHNFCRQYWDDREQLEIALQELNRPKRSEVRIAMFSAYLDALMGEILNDFCCEYSDVDIQIQQVDESLQMATKVVEDEVHIGMTYGHLNDRNLHCHARMLLPVHLLVNKYHPLADKREVDLRSVAHYPILLPSASCSINKIIQSEKIPMDRAIILDSVIARKRLAMAGRGGALMSTLAARQEIETGQLIAVGIGCPAFMSMEACLITRRGRSLSPVVHQVLELLAEKFSCFSSDTANPIPKEKPLFLSSSMATL